MMFAEFVASQDVLAKENKEKKKKEREEKKKLREEKKKSKATDISQTENTTKIDNKEDNSLNSDKK